MRALAPALRSFSHASRTAVDPPVSWPPSSELMYTSAGGANSTVTLLMSTSSSSAISIGIEVATPWPISERAQRIVTLLSGVMRTHAFGAAPSAASAAPCLRQVEAESNAAADGGSHLDEIAAGLIIDLFHV